jgi:hypothetical protein
MYCIVVFGRTHKHPDHLNSDQIFRFAINPPFPHPYTDPILREEHLPVDSPPPYQIIQVSERWNERLWNRLLRSRAFSPVRTVLEAVFEGLL